MTNKKFIHELPECRILVEQIAQSRGIRAQLVEKDYWLMHALWGLKNQGFAFELKGGTSLSKGFGIIDRFSEDIDIKIEPPDSMEVKTGKNHDKLQHIESRVSFYNWLSKQISIPGIMTERDTIFDDMEGRNGGIRLNFNSAYPVLEGIKSYVLLEVGFDLTIPNEKRSISSWVYEAAITAGLEIVDNRAKDIACYLPGYTFIEKLAAISRKHLQEQAGQIMPANFIRHYYDIYQLLEEKCVLDFIGTEAYKKHKAVAFRLSDEMTLIRNQAFILSNSGTREKYAKEYQRTQALYYGGFPEFNVILERIQSYLAKL